MNRKTQAPSQLQRLSNAIEGEVAFGQTTCQPAPAARPVGDATTGVVFVHGIGDQLRADTLLGWSGAITRAVASWAAAASPEGVPTGDQVIRSEVDFESSDLPLVIIRVPAATVSELTLGERTFLPQTWVMTEARWAQDVRPPSLETMIDWCGPRGVVASVVGRIVGQGIASPDPTTGGCLPPAAPPPAADPARGLLRALAEVGLSTFVSVVVTAGLLVYAVLRTLAGIVPYQPLKDAIDRMSLDTFLTTWWGDVYVLLDDPVQAANIRGQLDRSIRALRKFGCNRVVVVGHSGGTIVSYMALSDPALSASADTLVTHGQAIQMARAIYRAEGSSPSSPAVRLAVGATLRGVTRWHDLHATHDPAPAGRLDEAATAGVGTAGFCDTEVWNRLSMTGDHGGYFENDEEFLEALLSDIETTGDPGAPSRFEGGRQTRITRRRQRVYILALWKRLMYVLPLAAILTAFLVPWMGLIPVLRDVAAAIASAAATIVAVAPGSTELGEMIASAPSIRVEGLVTAAASVVATFYIFAIAKAIMPIGRIAIWSGARKWFFLMLDFGVFLVAVAIAWLAPASLSGDPLAAFRDLRDRVVNDPAVLSAILVSVVVVVVLAVGPIRTAVVEASTGHYRATRLTVLGLGSAVLWLAAYGIVVDEGIRTIVSATAVALLGFGVLGKIGTWRWDRWDVAERTVARERKAPFRRRWIWLQFLFLGGVGVAAAIGIAVGLSSLLILGGIALVIALVVFVIADVAVLKEPGVPNPTVGAGQA